MSQASSGREPPRLLPGAGRPSLGVTLAILVLSIVATLDIIAAPAAVRLLQAWPARLAGSITVATTSGGVESADAAAARVVESLASTPGIASARVLDPASGDDLAARLMIGGDATSILGVADTTTARLIRADFTPQSLLRPSDIPILLGRQGLRVAVDDHDPWTGPVERTALIAGVAAAATPLLALFGVWAVTAWRAPRAVARRRDRVSLLIHLGATEATLARPFTDGLILAAALGSGLGSAASAGAASATIWAPSAAIWLASRGVTIQPLAGVDLAGVPAWPVAATLVAALVARGAMTRALRELA